MKVNYHMALTGRAVRTIFVLAAALSLAMFTQVNSAASQEIDSPPTAVEEVADITTHIIEIRQFKFFPETLRLKKGDRVLWKNVDVVPHTATATDKTWDSPNLKRNDEWAFIAEQMGEIEYFCRFHPAMKATLIVAE